ncbi:E2 domain-containing protein [Sphingopyxis macrogoltabida]|uniref:E2 domain-containing protein n=1 Tax=Sphingopyxis macrogoltabida TaxID=33050 RepID=UPI000AF0DA0F
MTSAIRHLADHAPAWFTVDNVTKAVLVGSARVSRTPWANDGLRLRIFGDPKPRASEDAPGSSLPARCPERHIQSDKTFCLGLRYMDVHSQRDAEQWWEQLRQFLVCQGVAERTGVWPPSHALDHGDAGKYHEKALALAAEGGLEEEYASARLNEPSWLTDHRIRLFDKTGGPINGRALCPRGCMRCARGREVRILRVDCPKRKILVDLAYTERRRRKALAAYWEHVFCEGTRCCRTMRSCPLGQHEDAVGASISTTA